jgi:hypothetical protein
VIGGLIFMIPFFSLSYLHLGFIVAFSVLAHPVVNLIAYHLKLKNVWW